MLITMKPIHHLITSLLASLLTISSVAHAEIQMLDRIVAIVDQTTVTQSELDGRIEDIVMRSSAAGVNLPEISVLRKQVLDQLVQEALQINISQRYGIQTSDEEVLQSLKNIMAQQKIDEAQLAQSLASEGMTINEFKENLRRQMTLQKVAQGVVGSRIRISEQDIDNFLKSADAKFWISPQYHLQHILIPVQSNSGSDAVAEAEQKAESIFQQLQEGANFGELAIAESRGPAALKGGDLGWRKSSELPTLFAEIVPTLEINEVAKPARSQAGFHILKLLEKRGETKQMVTQSDVRHILVEPNEILDKEAALEKIKGLRQQILDGADFAELAKEHSDDIGSKMSGGSLGWSNPGTFVPEFEATVDSIETGVLSEPILTQFGWHILEVLDRREEDLSERVIRNRAYNLLVSRRYEDEVQVWLQELRDDAFIEIKI